LDIPQETYPRGLISTRGKVWGKPNRKNREPSVARIWTKKNGVGGLPWGALSLIEGRKDVHRGVCPGHAGILRSSILEGNKHKLSRVKLARGRKSRTNYEFVYRFEKLERGRGTAAKKKKNQSKGRASMELGGGGRERSGK